MGACTMQLRIFPNISYLCCLRDTCHHNSWDKLHVILAKFYQTSELPDLDIGTPNFVFIYPPRISLCDMYPLTQLLPDYELPCSGNKNRLPFLPHLPI
jgi:hypothetical protein